MTLYDILHSTIFYIPQRGVHGLARSSLPILYYTILYYTILYYTILYCTVRPVHLLRVFTSLENGRTGSRGPPARDRRARAPPAGRMWRAVFITVSSLYVCMFVCMYIHIYTHTYISLSIFIYIYIYIYHIYAFAISTRSVSNRGPQIPYPDTSDYVLNHSKSIIIIRRTCMHAII